MCSSNSEKQISMRAQGALLYATRAPTASTVYLSVEDRHEMHGRSLAVVPLQVVVRKKEKVRGPGNLRPLVLVA